MRKILLATTALVAVAGVSAANADVSFSAGSAFVYNTWSDFDAACFLFRRHPSYVGKFQNPTFLIG